MMKMNEKWRTYWTSNITDNNYNIMSIEKNMISIYINTTLMKLSSRSIKRL